MTPEQETSRLHEIISGIIGGDYIKGANLDRARIIADLIATLRQPKQWYRGNTPPKTGMYWVNLERDPGCLKCWFYYKEYHGWETDRQADGSLSPDWVNTQSPRMREFGPVACWAFVDKPSLPVPMFPERLPDWTPDAAQP